MNKLKTIVLMTLLAAFSLSARERWITMTYEMGFTAPGFHDFIDKPSFEGFGFNFYEGLSDYFMLGGRFGWNNFYQKIDRQSYNFTDNNMAGTITGSQWRRVSTMNFMLEGTFVARNSSILLPYISAGIGPSWDRKEQLIGIWSIDKSTVHLVLRPEIGLIVPFNAFGIKLSGGYNGIINNSDSGVDDIDHFTVGIGFALGQFN